MGEHKNTDKFDDALFYAYEGALLHMKSHKSFIEIGVFREKDLFEMGGEMSSGNNWWAQKGRDQYLNSLQEYIENYESQRKKLKFNGALAMRKQEYKTEARQYYEYALKEFGYIVFGCVKLCQELTKQRELLKTLSNI